MRLLDWVARIVVWVSSLALCAGLFVGSLFAVFAAIGDGASQAAANTSSYSTALASTPVLESDAFDVRKLATFLSEPRTGSSSPVSVPQAGIEQVHSLSTDSPALAGTLAPPATAVAAGAPDYVGSIAVNLRAGPSKNAVRLATLEPGEGLRVVGRSGSWVQVVTASGVTGWVFGKYLGGVSETEVPTAIEAVAPAGWEGKSTFEAESALAYFEPMDGEGALEPRTSIVAVNSNNDSAESSSTSSDSSAEVRESASNGAER